MNGSRSDGQTHLIVELEQWKDYYSSGVNAYSISVGGNNDFCIKQKILFILCYLQISSNDNTKTTSPPLQASLINLSILFLLLTLLLQGCLNTHKEED